MSIEYYLQGYWGEDTPDISLSEILQLFGTTTSDKDKYGFFPLSFGEGKTCDITVSEKDGMVTGICIHRPCADPGLYAAIFSLMRRGPFVLYAPDGNAPLVAQSKVASRLPKEMIAALGQARLVGAAEDIEHSLFS